MVERQVQLLHGARSLGGHAQRYVGEGDEPAAAFAGEGDDGQAEGARGHSGTADVPGVAAGAQGYEAVAGSGQGGQFLRVAQAVDGQVVLDGAGQGRVGTEDDGAQATLQVGGQFVAARQRVQARGQGRGERARALKALEQLARDVRGIGKLPPLPQRKMVPPWASECASVR